MPIREAYMWFDNYFNNKLYLKDKSFIMNKLYISNSFSFNILLERNYSRFLMLDGQIKYLAKIIIPEDAIIFSIYVYPYFRCNKFIIIELVDGTLQIDNTTYQFNQGLLHNKNNPSISNKLIEEWYLYSQKHRLDGPAIINHLYNFNEYWIHNIRFHKHEFEQYKINREQYIRVIQVFKY